MSISYSGITSYGKFNLPSVESWGNSMNILKDPPKSIHTRRKNKVGQTMSITEDIDAATDRAAESIRVYARGTNPAVSVMYSNIGTCGGALGSASGIGASADNSTSTIGRTQASLPYKIMQGGAFRPPVLTQRELMPLSRQPRENVVIEGQANMVDWTKKLRVCGTAENTYEVKSTMNTYDVAVPKAFKKVRGMEPTYELKYAVKDNLAAEGFTNKYDMRVESRNKSQVDTSRYTQVCLDVGEANTAKRDLKKFVRGVENNMPNLTKNVPNFAWERGAVPGKDYAARHVNLELGGYTNRGGSYMGNASKPVVY
jgi:hypothetical protein